MTAHPRQQDVRRLAEVRAAWCVTIYGSGESWLRGNHATGDAEAQIRAAVDALHAAGAHRTVVDAIRDRLSAIAAQRANETDEIDRRTRSVGIFATEDAAEVFALSTDAEPWVGAADRFLVGPLLEAALALLPPFFALAVSENSVRLVDLSAHPVGFVEVPGMPHDLPSTISLDLTGDRDTLAHLRNSEDPKGRLREYSRAIDRVLDPVLLRAGAVLVIAAAEPLASIYRATSSYRLLAGGGIPGNHDDDSAEELARLAEPVMAGHRRGLVEAQLVRLTELPDRDRVSTDLDAIAAATREGAVDTLLVDLGHRIPVRGEAFDGLTTLDRVDEIVRDALATDAAVVPVSRDDLPAHGPIAAVLRYARAAAVAR